MGTCPRHGHNLEKSGIIANGVEVKIFTKGMEQSMPGGEGPAAYQLVGRVTAYQGDDG